MWKKPSVYLLSFAIAIISLQYAPFVEPRRICGGTYTAAKGILTTPNFPGPFDVPARCQWIIDASNALSPNTSIVVYLTQLFLLEGLTFTEYQLYGNDYKINPKVIFKVNETNIGRSQWVQTFQSYLVIELKLQTAESAHLRVLDKFLDVFGFNITYEITKNDVRSPSCTMMDCGFTGVCYDDFTNFACKCFPGYSGPSCSEGPKSLCFNGDSPTCRNNAKCLHVGVSAIKCRCPKFFTGHTCQIPVEEIASREITGACAFDGRLENACKCLRKENGKTSNHHAGFMMNLHLGNLPNLNNSLLKSYIKKQILVHLQAEFSKVENLEVVNLIHYMSGADVSLQIPTIKSEEKQIRAIFNKWLHRGFIGNVTVSEKDNSITTLLSIESLDINQGPDVNENSEFILSCVAKGSPSITFRWFKDGVFINLTSAHDKWVKLIKDPHISDQYTALLAVRRPRKYDEGRFACQVEDFGIQQCRSKFVRIRRKPTVKIEPITLTVRKGENFTIKCITLENDESVGKKYTYSWTKNKELLPIKTVSERYEVLYPTGTILQVFRAERDVQYSCLVQDGITRAEKTAQVFVIDRIDVRTCTAETYGDQLWPEAAPDTESIAECPANYSGIATRKCLLRDGQKPAWTVPDFSNCINRLLHPHYEQFEKYKIGYVETSPENILENYLKYAASYRGKLLTGEGWKMLSLVQNVVEFMETIRMDNQTLNIITNIVLEIVDKVASSPDSVVAPNGVRLLHEVIVTQLKIFSLYMLTMEDLRSFNFSLEEIDITIVPRNNKFLQIPHTTWTDRKLGWTNTRLFLTETQNSEVTLMYLGIIFRSMTNFFPPKSFLRIKDGSEVEYELFSQIMSFIDLTSNDPVDDTDPFTIVFMHKFSTTKLNLSANERWSIKCGHADSTNFGESWDIYRCKAEVLDELNTRCTCSQYGSFVLLLVVSQPEVVAASSSNPQNYVILAGCLLGIALTLLTSFSLGISCILSNKSCFLILKFQCAGSMLLFQVLFACAVISDLPQQYFMVFLTFLEMFILLAMSSHLSKLLIVLSELILIPKPNTSKFTIIGIISGVPVITVFGNHLAYRTMDIKLSSWWLMKNSLATNIFVAVMSITFAMFIFIYVTCTKKLQDLWTTHEKHRKLIDRRIALVRRAGWLYTTILVYAISSILFVSFNVSIWNVYQFLIATFIMSASLFVCYVVFPETKIKIKRSDKSQNSVPNMDYVDSDLLNFLTRRDTDQDNLRNNLDITEFSIKMIENKKTGLSRAQSFSNAFESCLQTSTSFCDRTKEDATKQVASQSPIQSYTSSPQSFKPNVRSPDILSSKMCVEFDLVASSMPVKEKKTTEPKTVRIMFPPKVIITDGDDYITQTTPSIKGIKNDERFQPDGEAFDENEEIEQELESTKCQSSTVITESTKSSVPNAGDSLDGVLDSISQDLDFLLNRSEEVAPSPSLSKKNTKITTMSTKTDNSF